MAITNGYATLAQIKARLGMGESVVSTGVSFTAATKVVADANKSLATFKTGDRIAVAGSVSNNGTFTVASGGVAAQLTVSETLVGELAGASVRVSKVSDVIDDEKLESMVEGICRAIDEHLGRRFYLDSADATRTFTAERGGVLRAGDLVSVTSVQTDEDGDRTYERTWAAADWELDPPNAALDGKPYRKICVTPLGSYSFPTGRRGVKVTGRWGWPSVPKPVVEACLLMTEKLFKRKDAIFGVVGNPEFGTLKQMIREDPEVHLLLDPYYMLGIGAV